MVTRPVILLRGLFREKRHWGRFPEFVRNTFPERDIITLNVAGAGDRNHLCSPNNITDMVDDLRAQLAASHPETGSADIIGLSMGGMITLEWCQKYPSEINRAILINTSTRNFSGFHERLRWQQYGNILMSAAGKPEDKERFSYQLCSNRPVNEEIVEDWSRWAKENPMSAKSSVNQLIACLSYRVNHKPDVPMLILTSEKDKMVSANCSFQLARQWLLPIKIHPTAGHDIPLDDPEWVCAQAKAFFSPDTTESAQNGVFSDQTPGMSHRHSLTQHQAD